MQRFATLVSNETDSDFDFEPSRVRLGSNAYDCVQQISGIGAALTDIDAERVVSVASSLITTSETVVPSPPCLALAVDAGFDSYTDV